MKFTSEIKTMKNLLILILTIIFSFSSTYSQVDTCFTKDQIKNIYYKIKYYEADKIISDSIIFYSDIQIRSLEQKLNNDSIIKYSQQEQVIIYKEQNKNLTKILEDTKPKWYDDNRIWFSIGVVFTLIGTSIF